MRARWIPWSLLLVAALTITAAAQTRKTPKKATAKPAAPVLSRVPAEIRCPSELGIGMKTQRRFCDVMAGRDPQTGVLVQIPSHRGPVTISFDLHNRHTYSEEQIKARTAFRDYTAHIGVFYMDNTLIKLASIQSQFRTAADLFDRLHGGAGPGGMKAVAPVGSEPISIVMPEDVGEQVSLLGEKLRVVRPDGGVDMFQAPGRPIAAISNVMLEFRPGPPPRTPTKKP